MQYIGVDHHKKTSYLFAMDENGELLREGRIANTRDSLQSFLSSFVNDKFKTADYGGGKTAGNGA